MTQLVLEHYSLEVNTENRCSIILVVMIKDIFLVRRMMLMTDRIVPVIFASVAKVFERKDKINWKPDHSYEEISLGWYVHFEGSTESICLGDEQPPFKVG